MINEDDVEILYCLPILKDLGWEILHQTRENQDLIENNERSAEDVVLTTRLKNAITHLNPGIKYETIDEIIKKITTQQGGELIDNNHAFHKLLTEGIEIETRNESGELQTIPYKIIDFDHPENNEFLAVNQLTIVQDGINKRPDVILFINGLPLVIIELKNPAIANADMTAAYNQIQTYKRQISNLFHFNEICIISDAHDAKAGTISSDETRFSTWKTINGEDRIGKNEPELEPLLRGMLEPKRLLDIISNFIVFSQEGKKTIKKLAAYHQYWVVNKAIETTKRAIQTDHRAGVVWHTQGSGKSLSMLFYAGKIIKDPALHNPTIVVITDRIDLDGQLFSDTFSAGQEILRQTPLQAESRVHLRELLTRDVGGVIFSTIQKFDAEANKDAMPILSSRNNIIVIADEAHRSQYGFKAHVSSSGETKYGNAKYLRDALPNASFIGFTGTPIELTDRSTPAVFGEYIDIYDIERAVIDGSTVRIFYESRLVDLGIDDETRKWLDHETDGLLENIENDDRREELKRNASTKDAIVGNSERLKIIAKDVIEHFEKRLEALDGKGMIVTLSRDIATRLYSEIIALRPEWHSDNIEKGTIKIVMTGSSSDPEYMQPHIRNRQKQKRIEERYKDKRDPLRLVIVCDMWLTGFDVPTMHTMYLDKPLKAHNLMQAIARVNRISPNKDGGLIVDYLGIASALRDAMTTYTQSGGQGQPTLDIEAAVAKMRENYELVRDFFHGFDYSAFFRADKSKVIQIILDATEFTLAKEDGVKELRQKVVALYKAYSLSMPREEALAIREEVAFFQAVVARIIKLARGDHNDMTEKEYRAQLQQIVDKAIQPLGVVDIFEAAGINKPELPILSDEFLAEMRNYQRKNLAAAALEKLLKGQVQVRFNTSILKQRTFSEMIESALTRYKNGLVEAAQVIEELIEIAKKMREDGKELENLDLTNDEKLFYEALVQNNSAKEVLGDDRLCDLSRAIVNKIRQDTTIDWQYKSSTRARLRVAVKKVLAQYGYPPDQQKLATDLVMEQAQVYGDKWISDGISIID